MLKIFLAVLPTLLAFLGRLQGLTSQSSVDFSVITKYYVFQVRTFLPSCSTLPITMLPGPSMIAQKSHLKVQSVFQEVQELYHA